MNEVRGVVVIGSGPAGCAAAPVPLAHSGSRFCSAARGGAAFFVGGSEDAPARPPKFHCAVAPVRPSGLGRTGGESLGAVGIDDGLREG